MKQRRHDPHAEYEAQMADEGTVTPWDVLGLLLAIGAALFALYLMASFWLGTFGGETSPDAVWPMIKDEGDR